MIPDWWIAVGGVGLVVLTGITGVWTLGNGMGEIKAMIKELLERDHRTNKRVDGIEQRVSDHGVRIARIERIQNIE